MQVKEMEGKPIVIEIEQLKIFFTHFIIWHTWIVIGKSYFVIQTLCHKFFNICCFFAFKLLNINNGLPFIWKSYYY